MLCNRTSQSKYLLPAQNCVPRKNRTKNRFLFACWADTSFTSFFSFYYLSLFIFFFYFIATVDSSSSNRDSCCLQRRQQLAVFYLCNIFLLFLYLLLLRCRRFTLALLPHWLHNSSMCFGHIRTLSVVAAFFAGGGR